MIIVKAVELVAMALIVLVVRRSTWHPDANRVSERWLKDHTYHKNGY